MTSRILAWATTALFAIPPMAIAEEIDHLSALGTLRALHAWSRATESSEAFVFLELENEGEQPVSLNGASTKIAETVELVGFQLQDGEPTYKPIQFVSVNPGRKLLLEPDGLAIRLGGLSQPLAEGDDFSLGLRTTLGVLEVKVDVEARNATAQGHAGHSH